MFEQSRRLLWKGESLLQAVASSASGGRPGAAGLPALRRQCRPARRAAVFVVTEQVPALIGGLKALRVVQAARFRPASSAAGRHQCR